MTLPDLGFCGWSTKWFAWNGLAIRCQGNGSTEEMSALAAISAMLLTVGWVAYRVRTRQWHIGQLGAGLAILVALACLAVAAGRPMLYADAPASHDTILVVLDHSDSTTRDETARTAALDLLVRRLADHRRTANRDSRLSVFGFRGTAQRIASDIGGDDIAFALRRGETTGLAEGSNAAAGLSLALASPAARSGRTVLVLVSDGNWTEGDISRPLAEAHARDIVVHVMPTGASAPRTGLMASDIAPVQTAGAPAKLRLVIAGGGALSISLDDRPHLPGFTVPAARPGQVRALQAELALPSRGIHHVDLLLEAETNPVGAARHYTLVTGPTRVLVHGDPEWTDILDTQSHEVTIAAATSSDDPADYDVVVLDSLHPDDFTQDSLAALIDAHGQGTGIFLINGAPDTDPDAETNLAAWERTELGTFLPVSGDGRQIVEEPPPRDIILIIDASGSMGAGDGWRLFAAKQVARNILATLRPTDTARVVAFAESMVEVAPPQLMSDAARSRAERAVSAIRASGGTDPTDVLQYADRVGGNYCGIFFLSDGDFSTAPARPGCSTTVFEITDAASLRNPGLARLGDVKLIRRGMENAALDLKFFRPEPRKQRYRQESFVPVALPDSGLKTPALPVDGVAITYPRTDAVRVSVHPVLPPDPVMTMRHDPGGRAGSIGVFAGALPEGWRRSPAGREAVSGYVRALAAWSEPGRHIINVQEESDSLRFSVSVLDDDIPPPEAIDMVLIGAEARYPVALIKTDEPDTFVGRLRTNGLRPGETDLLLKLTEPGRAAQRIPIHLPDAPLARLNATGEAASWGVDRLALEGVARATGGSLLDRTPLPVDIRRDREPGLPIHGVLILIALCLQAAGLWFGGGRT